MKQIFVAGRLITLEKRNVCVYESAADFRSKKCLLELQLPFDTRFAFVSSQQCLLVPADDQVWRVVFERSGRPRLFRVCSLVRGIKGSAVFYLNGALYSFGGMLKSSQLTIAETKRFGKRVWQPFAFYQPEPTIPNIFAPGASNQPANVANALFPSAAEPVTYLSELYPFAYASVCEYRSQIYILGGVRQQITGDSILNQLLAFDGTSIRDMTFQEMPYIYGASAYVFHDWICIYGGFTPTGDNNRIFLINPEQQRVLQWSCIPSVAVWCGDFLLPEALRAMCVLCYDFALHCGHQ